MSPPASDVGRVAVAVDVAIDCDDDVDGERWSSLLAEVLRAEGLPGGAQVGLSFVTPAAMAELNATHMNGDGPTDVLAFPVDGRDAAGDAAGPPGIVGDIVVCPVVAAANASAHAGTPDDEIALLVVHGALHLVGHDHAVEAERLLMQGRERELMTAHHTQLAGDPWSDGSVDPAGDR